MSPIYSHGTKANLRAGRKSLESLIKSVTDCGYVLEAECGSSANSYPRRRPEDYINHDRESIKILDFCVIIAENSIATLY